MSYKWPDKDPDEVIDYSVDWSRFLNTDTISTVSWFVDNSSGVKTAIAGGETVNGIQLVAQTNTATVATAQLGLGTANIRYKVTCRVSTAGGLTYERSIFLRIREK